ncbi:MAG: YicC family protein [Porticoccaceae bacterium]|nr:YicC family protein [Porticoccaceae bacterium]|tara:strand:+ start:820 stop:1683 length:864 start_codon:yes stop_codon:yes gene_type:complete
MPRSMTAFARNTIDFPWGSVTCELRSVNHRFLETSFRLPETVREIEMPLREIARKKLTRGKVDCSVQMAFNNSDATINADLNLAKRYIDIAEQIARQIDQPAPISPLDIMRWPGILKDQDIEPESLHKAAIETFSATVDQLLQGRQREGDKLADIIEQRLVGIESQLKIVRENLPDILAHQRNRLNEKLLDMKAQLDQDRLEQEMVIISNRADVDEELDRLDTHLAEIRRVLTSHEPIGRRLDFLMQELNREANTLGSKSIAGVTTQASVELKVLIEQMREQIQNIE